MYENNLHYVFIGASAGGLEAIKSFFENINFDKNLCYLILLHSKSSDGYILKKILSNVTELDVINAEDNLFLKGNSIYIIPSNSKPSFYYGNLFLNNYLENKIQNPINLAFKSFSNELGERLIGIIMSGTLEDGVEGIKFIKENNGYVLIQNLQSSKFEDMPEAAIISNYYDLILPPDKMFSAIKNYKNFKKHKSNYYNFFDLSKSIIKFCYILKEFTQNDYIFYDEEILSNLFHKRIDILVKKSKEDYLNYLSNSNEEKNIVYNSLNKVCETSFDYFNELKKISSKIFSNINLMQDSFRIWVIGCSTGEEAYLAIILLLEYIKKNKIDIHIDLFATDEDVNLIERARCGVFSENQIEILGEKLIKKYFYKKSENEYIIKNKVREKIVFARYNIYKDPSFSKIDFIICRNFISKYNNKIKKIIYKKVKYSLKENGVILLDKLYEDLLFNNFELVSKKNILYKKNENRVHNTKLRNNLPNSINIDKTFNEMYKKTLKLIISKGVILSSELYILEIINDVSEIINLNSGKFSKKIYSYISLELEAIFNKAFDEMVNSSNKIVNKKYFDFKNKKSYNIKFYSVETLKRKIFIVDFILEEKDINFNNPIEESKSEIEVKNYLENKVKNLKKELFLFREMYEQKIQEYQEEINNMKMNCEQLEFLNEEYISINDNLLDINSNNDRIIKNNKLKTIFYRELFFEINMDIILLDNELIIIDAIGKTFGKYKRNIGEFIKKFKDFEFDYYKILQVKNELVIKESFITVNEKKNKIIIKPILLEDEFKGLVIAMNNFEFKEIKK